MLALAARTGGVVFVGERAGRFWLLWVFEGKPARLLRAHACEGAVRRQQPVHALPWPTRGHILSQVLFALCQAFARTK